MAKESSFDIVSTVDLQEVDNAYQQAKKEISQRYDLKGSGATLAFDKAGKTLTVKAPSDFVAGQVIDILSSKLVRRKIDLAAIKWGNPVASAGQSVTRTGSIIEGIDRDTASTIIKDIKAKKLKVQAAIQGDSVRVSGKNKDDLQAVIAMLRENDYDIELQFTNYR